MRLSALTAPLLMAAAAAMTACSGTGNSEVIRVVSERDSLRQVTAMQERRLAQINDVMTTLGEALDSVQQQEHLLFLNPSGEGTASRADALNNLNRFETVLRAQQRHIDDLEKKLAEANTDTPDNAPSPQAETLIANLRQQLSQKDTEALTRSSDMANRAFVAIDTKKKLEADGIIRKGKIQTRDALDRSKFRQVDIRKFTEITFDAKKPKVLTSAPQSTYTLTTDGKGKFILHITNPAEFWSISNFLVIQTQ